MDSTKILSSEESETVRSKIDWIVFSVAYREQNERPEFRAGQVSDLVQQFAGEDRYQVGDMLEDMAEHVTKELALNYVGGKVADAGVTVAAIGGGFLITSGKRVLKISGDRIRKLFARRATTVTKITENAKLDEQFAKQLEDHINGLTVRKRLDHQDIETAVVDPDLQRHIEFHKGERTLAERSGSDAPNSVPAKNPFGGMKPQLPPGVKTLEQFDTNVMKWGGGHAEARARIATLTAEELLQAGVTKEIAEAWRDFYLHIASVTPKNPSAAGRADLMQRAIDLLSE